MPPSRLAEGTPLALASAGDVETLVRAHGTTFIVTNRYGNVTPPGARELGFFHDDTRHLSHYELSLARDTLVHLSSDATDPACNRIDLMAAGEGDQEFLDDPRNFLHVRRRQLVIGGAFREHVEIESYLGSRVELDIVLSFAADFADVFEIRGAKRPRRGMLRSPQIRKQAVELTYEGLDRRFYRTEIVLSPAPVTLDGHEATFHLEIGARRTVSLDVVVTPKRTAASLRARTLDAQGSSARAFDEDVRAEHAAAERFADESTRFHCDNAALDAALTRSSADLHALTIDVARHRVLGAGIPWFACPFGRDTLIGAYEALLLNPALAASSLRALAAFQGTKHDNFTEEEPGKIFHELRSGEMVACKEIPHAPYYGTVDATPLFVVVLHATHRVTGDEALVSELGGALRAALAWIDQRSEEGTKLITYQRTGKRGLANQGWKDSRAGVSFPDGRRAAPPIALAEVQGYCVDAYRRGADLLAVLGDEDASQVYRARAMRLAQTADHALWLADEERYAFAIDGKGQTVPTIVSNIGHLLWSRVPCAERARATAELLVASETLSAFGLRTLASGQPVYNPLSYHNGTIWPHDNALIAKGLANYDLMDHACEIFDRMVHALEHLPDRRLPELFCGTTKDNALVRYPVACSPQAWAAAAPFLLLQAVLGIHVNGPEQRILIRNPRLPPSLSRVEIEGLRVGRSRVSLRVRRIGKRCRVDRLDVVGAPLRTFVELE